ncbi:MAG: efflux RND transporter periplasmic adaptor subunit [Vicinamibacteria bacterium]
MATSSKHPSFRTPLLLAALAASLLLSAEGCSRRESPGAKQADAARASYHCPMHPHYTSEHPGKCPICGMDLVPSERAQPQAQPSRERKVAYYRSPMDPAIHSAVPAKDPMGMDFIPVYEDETGPGSGVSGRAVVTLPAERLQMLGVRSERVRRAPLLREIRTVGRVAVDERRIHHVHTKFEGYVEHLYVDFIGKYVQKGDHLASIYSPELFATQQEYLLARRAQQRLVDSGLASVAQGSVDMLAAARQRLLLWDIRPDDIAEIERTGEARRTLDLHAEMSGYVIAKTALHGMRVTPMDELFAIADFSRLWVLADVYESDLPLVKLGMSAELTLPYLPGRRWRGPVTFVDPRMEEKTRTVKVRVEVDNQGQHLKPDMFADVLLRADLGEGLLVSDSAVLDSGDRKLVFLDRGEGRYEPRVVVLGARIGSSFQVIEGLVEGDRVVTAANFLLDSESSLKAAISAMSPSK